MLKSKKIFVFCFVSFFLFLFPSASLAAVQWGVYTDQSSDPIAIAGSLETSLGKKFENQLYYTALKDDFELSIANKVKSQGKHLQIVLEVWDPSGGESQPNYRLKTITAGNHDGDIVRWANSLKGFGDIIYLTPMSEMNGDWMPWCGTANGNDPTDYIPAWRHIHDIFASTGASNVRWIWSPNNESVPNTPANDHRVYYPGDSYVDYIGMNGYNFGPPINPWTSFYDTFMPYYQKIDQITASQKPVIIGEMATSETGGNKAAWINEMFQALPKYFPRIEQIYWFNVNKEEDWRIESSVASLEAFKSNFNPTPINSGTTKKKQPPQSTTTQSTITIPPTTDTSKVLGEITERHQVAASGSIWNQILPLWFLVAAAVLGITIPPILYIVNRKYRK